ncbi:hypothetical protein Hanom_Chr02g00107451 [Helianthus anomalus]
MYGSNPQNHLMLKKIYVFKIFNVIDLGNKPGRLEGSRRLSLRTDEQMKPNF